MARFDGVRDESNEIVSMVNTRGKGWVLGVVVVIALGMVASALGWL